MPAKEAIGSRDSQEYTSPLPEVIPVNPAKASRKKDGKPDTAEKRRLTRTDYSRHGWYSDAKKLEVACTYAVTGSAQKTAEIHKIKASTVRVWKTTEWWHEIQDRIRIEENDELDTKLTKLVTKAVDEINDRLEKGDYVYNAQKDKLIRKPINARDLSAVTATALDKRQLLRGEPTSRTEKVSENEKLVRLAEEFKKFALAKEIISSAQEIEDENGNEENSSNRHLEDDEAWEESEAGSGHSSDEGEGETEEDSEAEEVEVLTVNELFTE